MPFFGVTRQGCKFCGTALKGIAMRKYTIVDYFGYDLSPTDRMRTIREAGFDGVILLWADYFDADFKDFPEYADRVGLFVENTHAPYRGANTLWRDTPSGQSYTDGLVECVEDCGRYGIPTMVMHLANGRLEVGDITVGIERMRRIVARAEDLGVNVAVENTECPQFVAYVLGHISSPRLGFCYDSGHQNCYTPKCDLLGLYGDRLTALHLHDNDGSEDRHLLPFEGTVDWTKLSSKLNALGYGGCIALEAQNGGFEDIADPIEFLHLALKRAKAISNPR